MFSCGIFFPAARVVFIGLGRAEMLPHSHRIWIADGEAIYTPDLLYAPDRRIWVYFFHDGKCGGYIEIRHPFPLETVIACRSCSLEVPVPMEIAYGTCAEVRQFFKELNKGAP